MNTDDLDLQPYPTDKDSRFAWTIVRAPADRGLPLIVLARSCFGIRTHYWANRTGPHYRSNCPACDAGREPRWTGYLPCVNPADGAHVLFEYTPPAAEQLQAIIRTQGFLRGTQIIAARTKKVKNARVTVVSRGIYEHLDRLPPEPDVLPILFHIWGLKERKLEDAGTYDAHTLAASESPRPNREPGGTIPREVIDAARQVFRDLPGQQALPFASRKVNS